MPPPEREELPLLLLLLEGGALPLPAPSDAPLLLPPLPPLLLRSLPRKLLVLMFWFGFALVGCWGQVREGSRWLLKTSQSTTPPPHVARARRAPRTALAMARRRPFFASHGQKPTS